MNDKFDSKKELLRALLWAYLWLPLMNVVVQTAYFIILLGISESQGSIIAQIYNLTLPSSGVFVTQIFNWQLGKLFLADLIFRYVSFIIYTFPAPIVRFAILRKPIKKSSLAFLGALLSFAVGAMIHTAVYAPPLDPKAGAYNFIVQVPEYATMLFAFLAGFSLLRCQTSSSKGRWIREDEPRERVPQSVMPHRPAPPLRLTLDDSFPDSSIGSTGVRGSMGGGSMGGSMITSGEGESAGTIISGSAHFGTKSGGQLIAPDAPSATPAPAAPLQPQPTQQQVAFAQAQQAWPSAASSPVFEAEAPGPAPSFAADTARRTPEPSVPATPVRAQATPLAPWDMPETVDEVPAPLPPVEPVSQEAKPLPGDLASLLIDTGPTEMERASVITASEAPAPDTGERSLPDDLAALLKEIQVNESPDENLGETSSTEPDSSDETPLPDDLAALLKEIQVTDLPEEEGEDDDSAPIPTLEQLLAGMNPRQEEPAAVHGEPEAAENGDTRSPADETPQEIPDRIHSDAVAAEAIAVKQDETPDVEKCLLCDKNTADSSCMTLPNGWKIHQRCYDEAVEKLSSLKSDEETKAFFESSPNLMKVLFMTNAGQTKKEPREQDARGASPRTRKGAEAAKGGEPAPSKGKGQGQAPEKKKRAPRKTTKKTGEEDIN